MPARLEYVAYISRILRGFTRATILRVDLLCPDIHCPSLRVVFLWQRIDEKRSIQSETLATCLCLTGL